MRNIWVATEIMYNLYCIHFLADLMKYFMEHQVLRKNLAKERESSSGKIKTGNKRNLMPSLEIYYDFYVGVLPLLSFHLTGSFVGQTVAHTR